jgi:hypothetical protein
MLTNYNVPCAWKYLDRWDFYTQADMNMPALSQEEEDEHILVTNPGKEDVHKKMNECKVCNNYH